MKTHATPGRSCNLLTLYARREPTRCTLLQQHGLGRMHDTVVYADQECTQPKARFAPLIGNPPRRGQKRITLNCFRWALSWMPDLPFPQQNARSKATH